MQQHGVNILPATLPLSTPTDPWGGLNRSKFNYSKHCHVVNQIKCNHECSNMITTILNLFLGYDRIICDPYLTMKTNNNE